MPISLLGVQLTSAVVHEIPRAAVGGKRADPILSSGATALDGDLGRFFVSKVAEMADSEDCFRAEFQPQPESPVPDLVRQFFREEVNLTEMSQDCARHLAAIQTAATSPGLLAALDGVYSSHRCLLLLKLEHDEGVRVRRTEKNGRLALELEHVRELVLHQKTRLFKQALSR